MALYCIPTGKVTLTANATKSLILVNPAVVTFKVRSIEISLDAAAAAAAVQFDLYRVTTIGTPAGTTGVEWAADERDVAAQSTSLTALSTEPTAVSVGPSFYVQPLGGWQVYPFPFGAEVIGKGVGSRLGVRYVTPAGVSPDCLLNFWIEE